MRLGSSPGPLPGNPESHSDRPLTIAHSDSFEASVFLRMASAHCADAGWTASIGDLHAIDWDRLIAFALMENAAAPSSDDSSAKRTQGHHGATKWKVLKSVATPGWVNA
jgi:hypothetical protein